MLMDVIGGIVEKKKKKGNFLIGRRAPGKILEGKWEFPGGTLEKPESPEECLEREFWEEFRVKIKVKEKFGENVYGEIRLICYYAEYVSGKFKKKAHDKIKWVRPKNFKNYDLAPADIPLAEKLERTIFLKEKNYQ